MRKAWALLCSTETMIVGGWIFLVIALASLAGCAALGRGAVDGFGAAVAGTAAPSPAPGAGGTDYIGYGVGALVAYIIGSIGKGYVRRKISEREEGEE